MVPNIAFRYILKGTTVMVDRSVLPATRVTVGTSILRLPITVFGWSPCAKSVDAMGRTW